MPHVNPMQWAGPLGGITYPIVQRELVNRVFGPRSVSGPISSNPQIFAQSFGRRDSYPFFALLLVGSGPATFRGGSVNDPVAFASLPAAPVKGQRAYVTDCNSTTFHAVAAGGGANNIGVEYDGTNWRVGA